MTSNEEQKNPDKITEAFLQIMKSACYLAAMIGIQFLVILAMMLVWCLEKITYWKYNDIPYSGEEMNLFLGQKALESNNLIIIIYTLILIAFLLVFFSIRKKNLLKETNIRGISPRYLPALILIWIGMTLGINCGLSCLPEQWLSGYNSASSSLLNNDVAIIMILSNAICAPLSEELIFRGLMLGHLKKAFPVWVGILVTSLCFGLLHGQILWMTFTFLMGIVFAVVADHTGSLLSSMMVHALFNLYGTVLSMVPGREITLGSLYVYTAIGFTLLVIGLIWLLRLPKRA